MPCIKCENNKWRWGESGECKYDSLSQCEEANADYYDEEKAAEKEKKIRYEEYDWTYNFSEKQMTELHTSGELMVNIEKEDKDMKILFTYDNVVGDKSNDEIIADMLDDELEEHIEKLTNSIKKL